MALPAALHPTGSRTPEEKPALLGAPFSDNARAKNLLSEGHSEENHLAQQRMEAMKLGLGDSSDVQFGAGMPCMFDHPPAETIAVVFSVETQGAMLEQRSEDPVKAALRVAGCLNELGEAEPSACGCKAI
jgi:hypothetical protein